MRDEPGGLRVPLPLADLVDHLVADAADYLAAGVAAGSVRPSADPPRRAALLLLWSLGGLALNAHMRRLLGIDLTDLDHASTHDLAAYAAVNYELLGPGLLTPEFLDRLTDPFHTLAQESP